VSLKTMEQERAKFAYDKVIEVQKSKNQVYLSLVRGFASMVLLNGLGQALAFLKAKGKQEHILLYGHINLWMKEKYAPQESSFDILKKIREESSDKYRLYTRETLAFLVWMKKFSEAELDAEEGR